jgi:hypothetical protein
VAHRRACTLVPRKTTSHFGVFRGAVPVGRFRDFDVLGGYGHAEATLELNVEVEFRRLV